MLAIKNMSFPDPWECLQCPFCILSVPGEFGSDRLCFLRNTKLEQGDIMIQDEQTKRWVGRHPKWCPLMRIKQKVQTVYIIDDGGR